MSDTPTETPPTDAPTDVPTDQAPTEQAEPDTFTREYVEKLRKEAAGWRDKLRQTEELVSTYDELFGGLEPTELSVFAKGAQLYGSGDYDNAAQWFYEQYEGLRATDTPAPQETNMSDNLSAADLAAAEQEGLTKADLTAAFDEWQKIQEQRKVAMEVDATLRELGYDGTDDPDAASITNRAMQIAKETGNRNTPEVFKQAAEAHKAAVAERYGFNTDNQTETTDSPPGEGERHVTPPGGVAPGKTDAGDEPDIKTQRGRMDTRGRALRMLEDRGLLNG